MTGIHRLPEGHTAPHLVRPADRLADPDAMTGQAEAEMRASAMNALAHGADSLYTPFANPVSRVTALEGARLIAAPSTRTARTRSRRARARRAALRLRASTRRCSRSTTSICQTLVRVLGIPHAETNAAMLPQHDGGDEPPRAGGDRRARRGARHEPGGAAARIEALGGGRRRLSELGAQEGDIPAALDAILDRGELGMTPDPPDRDELERIIAAAW